MTKYVFRKAVAVSIIVLFIGAGITITSNMFVKTAKADLITELVGYWNFNEGSGTNAHDSAGSYHGTLTNMDTSSCWVDGVSGKALSFDGVNDYVNIGSVGTSIKSFNMWVKPKQSINKGSPPQALICFTNDIYNFGLGMSTALVEDETICISQVNTIPGYTDLRTAVQDVTISTDWHMITIVWNSGVNRYDIYFDGTKKTVTSGSVSHVPLMTCNNFKIGTVELIDFSDVEVDEVRIYNRALSDPDIQQLRGQGGGSVNYIRYDDFEDYNIGEPPKSSRGWTTVNVGGNNKIEARVDPLNPSNKVMLIHSGGSIPGCALMMYDFAPAGEYVIHYRIYTPQLSSDRTIYEDLSETLTGLVTFHRRTGQIRWGGSCGFNEFTPPIDPSTTKWIEEEIRVTQDEIHLWHDNSIDALGGYCNTPVNGIDHWSIHPNPYIAQDFYIDDFWIEEIGNQLPNTPSKPSGPTSLYEGESGTYTTSTTDPDGDQVQYRFDWNADGSHDYSSWSNLVPSGQSVSMSHSWDNAGTYVVKAQARDEHGKTSDYWSNGLTVKVGSGNKKPIAYIDQIYPNPGKKGKTIYFEGHGKDLDGYIFYYNWRSDIDGQLSTQASFSTSSLSLGHHTIYFKVKDDAGEWSDEVTKELIIIPDFPDLILYEYYPKNNQWPYFYSCSSDNSCEGRGEADMNTYGEGYANARTNVMGDHISRAWCEVRSCPENYAALYTGPNTDGYILMGGSVYYTLHNVASGGIIIKVDEYDENKNFVTTHIGEVDSHSTGVREWYEKLIDLDGLMFNFPLKNNHYYAIRLMASSYSSSGGVAEQGSYAYLKPVKFELASWWYSPIPNNPPYKPSKPNGPTSGDYEISYTYSTSTTDPEGHQIKYCFDWDFGTQTYTEFYDSGRVISTTHIFHGRNIYNVKVQAIDFLNKASEWSDILKVNIGNCEISGLCLIDLKVTDAEGHFINKTFSNISGATYTEVDIDGDGDLDDLVSIPPIALDGLYTIEVIPEPDAEPTDTYSIKAKLSGSYFLAENVTIQDIPPEGYEMSWPNKPATPDGPSSDKVGETYTYTSSCTDPDGDQIYYLFDWGDGTDSGWIGIGEASHKWTENGNYDIRVIAKDIHDFESYWSDPLTVIIDDTPPFTTKTVSIPKHGENDELVTSASEFNLTATDDISGVDKTYNRIWYNDEWTDWIEYTGNFTLSGEGKHYLEYYSVDNAGNIEEVHNQTHYVDDSPPVITISASPNELWPPNHKMKNVLISGSATDAGSGIASVTFAVIDEYDQVEPTITHFGQTIQLEAWRNGDDMDGRTYTITATATDNLGNVATASTVVLVPHDQGN